MPGAQKEATTEKKGGKKTALKWICVVVVLILLALLLYFLLREKPKRNVVVNEEDVAEAIEQLNDTIPAGYYEAKMNSTWNFPSGDAPSENAYVENTETNTCSVYFDVTRTDTDETILESPILPVGSHLDNITLDTELPDGTYDCLITYHLLDGEEEETISTLRMTLTIIIGQPAE